MPRVETDVAILHRAQFACSVFIAVANCEFGCFHGRLILKPLSFDHIRIARGLPICASRSRGFGQRRANCDSMLLIQIVD
jgi:hypothetical protein